MKNGGRRETRGRWRKTDFHATVQTQRKCGPVTMKHVSVGFLSDNPTETRFADTTKFGRISPSPRFSKKGVKNGPNVHGFCQKHLPVALPILRHIQSLRVRTVAAIKIARLSRRERSCAYSATNRKPNGWPSFLLFVADTAASASSDDAAHASPRAVSSFADGRERLVNLRNAPTEVKAFAMQVDAALR